MKKKKLVLSISAAGVVAGLILPSTAGYAQEAAAVAAVPGEVTFTHDEYTGKIVGEVKNADIVGINVEDATANLVGYHSAEAAMIGARDYAKEQSIYYQLLTGTQNSDWDLVVTNNMEGEAGALIEKNAFAQMDFEEKAVDGVEWQQGLQLPASWTYFGFDYPVYTNVPMPWQGDQNIECPEVPTDYNPVGFYRKKFVVDDGLYSNNGRIYLTFAGVESAYYVYVNGYAVGYSEDSFGSHSFDITDFLNPQGEENILAVEVHKFSDGTWMEDQDFIYDGGIFRDVYLYAKPLVNLKDYTVQTELDEDYQGANLNIDNVNITNLSDSDIQNYVVTVQLYDENGTNILEDRPEAEILVDEISAKSEVGKFDTEERTISDSYGTLKTSIYVENPKLWSSEDPNLYTLVLSLYNRETGEHLESVSQQLGFRELHFTRANEDNDGVEMYDQVTINGQDLLIKGVNRHETDLVYGKYIRPEIYEEDLKLMKQNNINTIRTSHYTDDDYLYYLADKYGLYVIAETNLESHAIRNAEYEEDRAKLVEMALSRTQTSFQRFKNTTSVIMWSVGNEIGAGIDGNKENSGSMFYDMIWYFKDRDDTRMVHSCDAGFSLGTDMNSQMYPAHEAVQAEADMTNNRPYLMCEYSHAMGNAVGSLKEYWDIIRSAENENMLGGCIWDWVDQNRRVKLEEGDYNYYASEDAKVNPLYAEDLDGYYLGYGGDFGDAANNSDSFCSNGLISADRTPQPEIYEVKYQYQSIWMDDTTEEMLKNHQVNVYNEYGFTNLNNYQLMWEVYEDGILYDSGVLEGDAIDVAPGETKQISVPYTLPEELKDGSEYFLNLYVLTKEEDSFGLLPQGHEMAHEQLQIPTENIKEVVAEISTEVQVTDDGKNDLLISGNDFSFEIHRSSGAIKDYTYKGEVVAESGPVLNFWRATVEDDRTGSGRIDERWMNANEGIVADSIEVSENEAGQCVITANLRLPNANNAAATMIYTVNGDGAVTVNISMDTAATGFGRMIKFGSMMTLPAGYENVTWYGNGPVESYSDRYSFATRNIFESTVTDFYYPFVKSDDSGNLTGVKWITVQSEDRDQALLIAGNALQAQTLHYQPKDMEKILGVVHPYEVVQKQETYLSVDLESQGLGYMLGRSMEQYQVSADKTYEYQYTIIPYSTQDVTEETLATLAKPYWN